MSFVEQMSIRSYPDGISVIVPVYNSEGILANLASRLESVLKKTGQGYEMILINDGSRDTLSG